MKDSNKSLDCCIYSVFCKHFCITTKLMNYLCIFAGMDTAIYRRTRKGGIKLMHRDYEYFKTNVISDGSQAWRCVNFTGSKWEKCSVRAYTRSFGLNDVVEIKGVHMHPPRQTT